jgi:hypothetical protein
MALIVVMYVDQTIHTGIGWYLSWLTYIKYAGSSKALAVFLETEDTPSIVLNLTALTSLLIAIRLGIADSILVSFALAPALYCVIIPDC